MGLFNDFITEANGLNIFRTSLDAGGQIAVGYSIVAAIAFVHHAVAGEIGQHVEIEAHAGLSLRNVPGANLIALGTTQADIRIDP